jgi:hypothetical protein
LLCGMGLCLPIRNRVLGSILLILSPNAEGNLMYQVIDEYTDNRVITLGLVLLFILISNLCLWTTVYGVAKNVFSGH